VPSASAVVGKLDL
jgi:hypothetical protein